MMKKKKYKSHFSKLSTPEGIKRQRKMIQEYYSNKRKADKRKTGKMEDKRKFILIKTDMTVSTLEIDDDKLLDTSYELLDCECIEVVSILLSNCLITDDSGKLKEKKTNPLCSLMYAGWVVGDYIVGDALLDKRAGPDIIGLNESELEQMLGYLEYLKSEVKELEKR